MPGVLEAVDAILPQVDGGYLAGRATVETLLEAQISLRNSRCLQTAMRSSRLPALKTIADFDFSLQASVKRAHVESLHTLGFLERRENVLLLGPPAVGETHLPLSLTAAAGERGRRVYYTTLAELITSREAAQQAGHVMQRRRTLTFPSLMIIDEIGYAPISRVGAMLFFHVIARR